jgi:putative IMPACT (imprinted ancient) family translation regulator
VLDAIDGAGLRETAVVVTRWFGGTKLGTGGLSRAYAAAAGAALAALPTAGAIPATSCRVRFDHPDTGAVMRLLDACGARRGASRYGRGVELDAIVPRASVRDLARALADATGGRAGLDVGEETRLLVALEPPDVQT